MTTDPVPIRTLRTSRDQLRSESDQQSAITIQTTSALTDAKSSAQITAMINQAIGAAYPDTIVPVFDTIPGTPSVTAAKPSMISPAREDIIQSESSFFNQDYASFGGSYDSIGEQTKQTFYDNSVAALSPIGNSLAGQASEIVAAGNAVTNTMTSTANSVLGAITDVLSGRLLMDTATGLMSTATKLATMVGEAAYVNVMGFLESFKSLGTILNSAGTIASDMGQSIRKAGEDVASVISSDWDSLSWPKINWDRIKSGFDTETFNKIGLNIGNFSGTTKYPIGLSQSQIAELTKNLEVKEQLLAQVEAVKNGTLKLSTGALNSLYGNLAEVNTAILNTTKLPDSQTSMFNSLANRLDPLKERAANKVIMDYIKDGKVVKAGDDDLSSFNQLSL